MAARKRKIVPKNKPVPPRRAPTPRGVDRESQRALELARPDRIRHTSDVSLDRIGYVKTLVRDIADFPKPGILFRDITPLLSDPRGFHIVLDALAERFVGEHVDAVVGVESRGFIFGGALAARLNASFVPVRKPGKLPAKVDRVSYSLEYGENELEMHRDSLAEGTSVIVVDDLLATGGTAAAAGELVHRQGAYVVAYAFVLELDSLQGRDRLLPTPVFSLLHYE
jgi:adenine phosphoribosyltransferase